MPAASSSGSRGRRTDRLNAGHPGHGGLPDCQAAGMNRGGFNHVALAVTDLEETVRFYENFAGDATSP
jgi:hypothetical protein